MAAFSGVDMQQNYIAERGSTIRQITYFSLLKWKSLIRISTYKLS